MLAAPARARQLLLSEGGVSLDSTGSLAGISGCPGTLFDPEEPTGCHRERTLMPTVFIPFIMTATVRDGSGESFRTEVEVITSTRLGCARMDVLRSTKTEAVFRGVIPESEHTVDGASLARHLEDRLASEKCICLDVVVSIEG